MDTSKQVVIRPINKAQFSGIAAHAGTTVVFQGAQLDFSTGSYRTGLTVEEEAKYETELGLPKGRLNKKSDFWADLPVRLHKDKPTYFEVASLLDELKLKTIKARSTVAINELDKQNKANAQFVIEDLEAQAKAEELIIDAQFDALEAFNNMSIDEKKGYLRLYGKRGVDTLSDKIIKTQLYTELNKNPKKFLEYTKDPDVTLRMSIEDMLESGKLTKRGNYYSFENEVIGNTVDSVVAYFKDVKNQSVKIAIEKGVRESKKGK